MAKRKNKKNQQALKGLVVVIIIAIITILGDKIKLDNINNLVEEVSSNNVATNQVVADSSEAVDGEDVDVYYLDVGQADSILVQSNGMNMLIDAGTNDMGKTVVRDLQALGIKKIDVLIGSYFCRQCRCTSCHPFRHPILAGIGSGKRRTGRAWSCHDGTGAS